MVSVYEYMMGPILKYGAPFADIAGNPYRTNIEKAHTAGLVAGTSDTQFSPGDLITREQAARLLCNIVLNIEEGQGSVKPSGPPTFADQADISSWAVNDVAYAQQNHIMEGVGGNRFDPKGKLTREMAMLMAERLLVRQGRG